ncbi:lipopolysaccharide kinase InaA family protein [Thalassoroseus pseudoceratinae]|uniref:lipopolysaccharide kinase InaA family protein n=1 Tax=Thalassoroseus pseudoceratinae TaxID=2713176 RepID=UPI00141E002F|nr:lipopolysaccharide kinase InaA family protein [Thalassoroseus pseudoceratinae]
MTTPWGPTSLKFLRRSRLRRLIPLGSSSSSDEIVHLRRSRGVGRASADLPRDVLIRLIDCPELPLRAQTRDIIKAGRTAVVVRADMPFGSRMVSVAYKQVHRRTFVKVLTAVLRGNRTLRSWRMGRKLLAADIPTARPLAVVTPRWYRPDQPSYIVTEWIVGGENITQLGDRLKKLAPRDRARQLCEAAEILGQLIGRLHAAGFSHRDLKAGNVMVIPRAGRLQSAVIDLDGVSEWWRVPLWARLRNLARFVVGAETSIELTHGVRLRFLQAYLAASGLTDRDWQPIWRRLARRVRQVQRRKSAS